MDFDILYTLSGLTTLYEDIPAVAVGSETTQPNDLFFRNRGHTYGYLGVLSGPSALGSGINDVSNGPTNIGLLGTTGLGGVLSFPSISQLYVAPAPIPAVIPEPSTILLLGSGLLGVAGYGRKKRQRKSGS